MRTKRLLLAAALLLLGSVLPLSQPVSATEAQQSPRVVMTTPVGDIVIEVYLDRAPISAANFLDYVDRDLFGGAHFYRAVRMDNQPNNEVKIEVIQGGLGFEPAERKPPISHETTAETGVLHLDGTISMARIGPGTATSEFFICVGDQPDLDFGGARNPDGQGFAAFGQVVDGMAVVRSIQKSEADGQMLAPIVPITDMRRLPVRADR